MAGGASADPPPFWLIILTLAVYLGFLLVFNNALPDLGSSVSNCTSDPGILGINCVGVIFTFFAFIGSILTLGGISSPLPLLIQGPLVLFFGLTWGIIIFKMLTNTLAAIIP